MAKRYRRCADARLPQEPLGPLIIAERTAEGHVQSIFNKLGFNARTQIAAWAVEHGLRAAPPG